MNSQQTNKGQFEATDRTTISRLSNRGSYDRETIHAILDEALFCTLAYNFNGTPFQIPTGFVRMGDQVYLHGSVGSYLRSLADGKTTVSIGATIIDGLVLARSAFHHSVNYRSVVLFSNARATTDEKEIVDSLAAFTEKMIPGRWADIRKPSAQELKKTLVLAIPLNEASAKVRTGPPVDDEQDYEMNVWAGVVPLQLVRGTGLADARLKEGIPIPGYLRNS